MRVGGDEGRGRCGDRMLPVRTPLALTLPAERGCAGVESSSES